MLPLKVERLNQLQPLDNINIKGVYSGTWRFKDFVHSIKFTFREPLAFRVFGDQSKVDLTKKYPEFNYDYYQRLLNDDKTKKVINFVIAELKSVFKENKTDLIPFPTSLILSTYLTDATSIEEYQNSIYEIGDDNEFNEKLGIYFDDNKIYLSDLKVVLVVDGQHRLAGILCVYEALKYLTGMHGETRISEKLSDKLIDYARRKIENESFDDLVPIREAIENFQFQCTILLDFDIWEQGKVFADVNFNQKPVNKSLYYDIFGSYPDPDRNDLYLAHSWTVFLNAERGSPFEGKIKMLGNGNGYFSQAFLVEALFPLLRKDGIWNRILADFIKTGLLTKDISTFLKVYFGAIEELYKLYWPIAGTKPSAYKNVLFKTTGLGALIKLINFIFPKVEHHLGNEEQLKNAIKSVFTTELNEVKINLRIENYILQLKQELQLSKDPESIKQKIGLLEQEKALVSKKVSGEYYFSKDGAFSKGAGKGLQDKLYKELAFDLGFIKVK